MVTDDDHLLIVDDFECPEDDFSKIFPGSYEIVDFGYFFVFIYLTYCSPELIYPKFSMYFPFGNLTFSLFTVKFFSIQFSKYIGISFSFFIYLFLSAHPLISHIPLHPRIFFFFYLFWCLKIFNLSYKIFKYWNWEFNIS